MARAFSWSDKPFAAAQATSQANHSAWLGGSTYQITGLSNGTTYFVAVTAIDMNGNESGGSPVEAGAPALVDALSLSSIDPPCIADNTFDIALTLVGTGFNSDMTVTISGKPVEIVSTTATEAHLLLRAKTFNAGAFTVKVLTADDKVALIGEAGLLVGNCAAGHQGASCSSGTTARGHVASAIALLFAALLIRRRRSSSAA